MKMLKTYIIVGIISSFLSGFVGVSAMSQEDHSKSIGGFIVELYQFSGGIIRNELTAIRLAKVIMEGLHGKEFIAKQEPWSAKEDTENWIIQGSPSDIRHQATIVVSKADGRVLRIEVPANLENK